MGAAESALGATPPQCHPKGISCIAAAAETNQRILHIPLLCGATTSVDFSTVLGEGSYGVVYGGTVDRSTCRHSTEGVEPAGPLMPIDDETTGNSRQSSAESRQGCQYCFSDRTRHVAVKALRHSSQRQQRFFLNRFKFLQLIRLQQLLSRSQEPALGPQELQSTDVESGTTASSKEDESHDAVIPCTASAAKDKQDPPAAASSAAAGETSGTSTSGGTGADEGGRCSCCTFLQFPSFESLHLLQVFGVYACSRGAREYLVMEKLSGPTLFGYLCSKYSEVLPKEWEACQIIVPILKGLCCIHEEGFIHGDIKLENIMFRSAVPYPSTLTLVDLDGLTPLPCAAARAARAYSVAVGITKQQVDSRKRGPVPQTAIASSAAAAAAAACKTSLSSILSGDGNTLEGLCCTPQYLPVEVVRERKLSPFADLHAVGCICYLLMEGCFPHERINLKSQGILSSGHICQKLSRDVRYPRVKQKYSPLCENFMRKLLSSDPKYRFSSAAEALRHPWIDYARSLQTPDEVQQERKLLRSVLAAAEEAAEKAVEAADKAAEAAKEQREAEAAAAAAAAVAAEAAAIQAEAALRAAREAAAAAAAAAKKAMADQKVQQAAAAAAAARAEKARAEQAAEESAAAVVALAQCQEAADVEKAGEELQLLLSPHAAAARRNKDRSPYGSRRQSGMSLTQEQSGGSPGAAAPVEEIADRTVGEGTAAAVSTGQRASISLQRDDSFCRGAARFVAAAKSPRKSRRRGASVPRAAEAEDEGGVGGAAYGSTADSSAFVLLDQQQRAFAKGGAVAAAARPSITGAVRGLRLATPQAGKTSPLGARILRGPIAKTDNAMDSQAAGELRAVSPAVSRVHLSFIRGGQPLPRQRLCSDIPGRQPKALAGALNAPIGMNSNKADEAHGPHQVHSEQAGDTRTEEGQSPPSWYNGIVSFLEGVGSPSPRQPMRMS